MIVFYISGHGLGHASRDIEVMNALHARRPDLPIVVRTSAAKWLFDLTAQAPIILDEVECDAGVVQIDSLRLDEQETIRRASAFERTLPERADREAQVLRGIGAVGVIGDIPPLAFEAARRAGVPSIALGNFTWDWIYEGYAGVPTDAPDLLPAIRDAYGAAGLALRLPMHGGFDGFRKVVDIPFIARRSRRDPDGVRAELGLPANRTIVLLSFGGYGLDGLDLRPLARLGRFAFVTVGDPPRGSHLPNADGGVIALDERQMYRQGCRYEDLVAASDVVVTKPGYGIIAESIANHAAILYTSRGRFVEYEVLVREMPRYTRCAFIGREDLFAGNWEACLDRLLAQPAPRERPAVNGAEVAANLILEWLERR